MIRRHPNRTMNREVRRQWMFRKHKRSRVKMHGLNHRGNRSPQGDRVGPIAAGGSDQFSGGRHTPLEIWPLHVAMLSEPLLGQCYGWKEGANEPPTPARLSPRSHGPSERRATRNSSQMETPSGKS